LTPYQREPETLGLPAKHARDRLERTVVLNEVRQLERQERMRDGMMKKSTATRTETGLRDSGKEVPKNNAKKS